VLNLVNAFALVAVRGAGGVGAGEARNFARSLSQVRVPEPPLVIINLIYQDLT
jgi:hypothetical protein